MSDTEKNKLFEILMDCMVELNLEDIPNFALKLLSVFALEANAKYVGRLLEFFCSLTTRARYLVNGMPAIRSAQSSIILHLVHTARMEQNFGKTLLNAFKAQALVKSSVTECAKKKLNVKSSKWLRSVIECSDLRKTVDSLISYESDSWEYVIEGLCELGFTLLEVYPGRSVALRGSLQYELFSLGKYLITECFKGLAKAASDHPAIREPVLDLLFRQLEQYLPDKKSNRLSIFNLEACATTTKDGAHLLEPVGTLISAITSLVKERAADESDSYCQQAVDFVLLDKVKCGLGSLASHVADSQLEDFNLDKSVSYSHEETAGQKNTLLGYQFLSMVEALVEFFIFNFDDRKETADSMLKLYTLWSKMDELLRERLGCRAQKRKLLSAESQMGMSKLRTTYDGSARCCVSISAIVSLLSLMFSKSQLANEAAISLLQNEENFVGWLFALAQRRLTALDVELSRREVFEDICVLSRYCKTEFDF
ncbi:FANCI HD2 domain containing protein [Trichuris trichiura]|uniref:FANCI HD2 domain containing protein n=1 Tax=Trichuris trichiura TaxID=36087 RepID=A0A077ZQG4_TRITR|nr:FANCI HD2 domain containing protein [Trichuris trichiura]